MMKMIFVDAENIGLKELEKVNATIIDKVFVFSKVESIKRVCEQQLFLCLSDYPSSSNQADFYIIAYLSRILASIPKSHVKNVEFCLYTNDTSLIDAFEFQCALFGAKTSIIKTKDDTVVPIQPKTHVELVFEALHQPRPLNDKLQKQLGLTKAEFCRAITSLNKANKIIRSPSNKKHWVQKTA
ncbi:hypothetical protein AAEU29_10520 [Pseudoalteromonas sp. SSM20]|uniref:hypothetical protein n=1 Tax=Pseudoalteromonas sp. SSM20 TaxID=3139394 RepID=UPI003BA8E15B